MLTYSTTLRCYRFSIWQDPYHLQGHQEHQQKKNCLGSIDWLATIRYDHSKTTGWIDFQFVSISNGHNFVLSQVHKLK